MSIKDSFRKRMQTLTGRESVAALKAMENHLQGGAKWTQGAYERGDGSKCLVGAANYVQRTTGNKLADPKYWIGRAIAERQGGVVSPILGIESFNDSRGSYHEIAGVLGRAKELAAGAQLPASRPAPALPPPVAGEILPPVQHEAVPVMIDVTPRARVPARRRD